MRKLTTLLSVLAIATAAAGCGDRSDNSDGDTPAPARTTPADNAGGGPKGRASKKDPTGADGNSSRRERGTNNSSATHGSGKSAGHTGRRSSRSQHAPTSTRRGLERSDSGRDRGDDGRGSANDGSRDRDRDDAPAGTGAGRDPGNGSNDSGAGNNGSGAGRNDNNATGTGTGTGNNGSNNGNNGGSEVPNTGGGSSNSNEPTTTNEVAIGPDLVPCEDREQQQNCIKTTDFGAVTVGSTRKISLALTSPVPIRAISLAGANSGDFRLDRGTCTGGARPEATTDTCTLHVTFTPTAQGLRTAELSIKFEPEQQIAKLPLTGIGN